MLHLMFALLACRHTPPQPAAELTLERSPVQDPVLALEEGARSMDISVRRRSLELLIGFSQEPGGGMWGPRALFDPSPYVKRSAVDALANRGDDPAAWDLLVETVGRSDVDPYVRGHAGVLLAERGDLRAADTLSEAWRAERLHWRRAPLALAAAAMGDADALAQLQVDLARGDMPLEMQFYLDIGETGLTVLADPLHEGLRMLEPELELPVAISLIRLDDKRGMALIKDVLGGSLDQRLEVIDFAADLPGDPGTELINKARMAGPQPVRRYAELALVARGEAPPQAAFDAMVDPDRELRQQAVWATALWLQGQEGRGRTVRRAQDVLRAGLADPEPTVVQEAVRGLALVGRPEDRELLATLLGADAVGLSVEAAGAILAIDNAGVSCLDEQASPDCEGSWSESAAAAAPTPSRTPG
jgi:HEAT repeat protein